MQKNKVIVTGDHKNWETPDDIDFKFIPVLEYKRLDVDPKLISEAVERPFDWILFTSPRAVQFFTETLVAQESDLPVETQVACIGESTCEAAEMDGYTPDFYPTETGSENFLKEFEFMISNNLSKPRILIPGSSQARPLLKQKLSELGCEVITVATYDTFPKDNIAELFSQKDLSESQLFLFTSPSSVDAVLSNISLPSHLKIAAMGSFTKESLDAKGFQNAMLLPQGKIENLGELFL